MKRLKLLAVLPLAAATVALGSQAATAATPAATLSPASGANGTTTTVTLTGFKANTQVAVLQCKKSNPSASEATSVCNISAVSSGTGLTTTDASGNGSVKVKIDSSWCASSTSCTIGAGTLDQSQRVEAVFTLKSAALKSFTAAPKPTITGKAKVGKKLTAHAGTWKPTATLKYQWLANGKKIAHATKATYKIAKKYKGKHISVKVTGSRAGYKTVSKVSKATAKVK